jgi:hypothetical protein
MASPTAEDDCEGGSSVVDGPVANRADHGGVAPRDGPGVAASSCMPALSQPTASGRSQPAESSRPRHGEGPAGSEPGEAGELPGSKARPPSAKLS